MTAKDALRMVGRALYPYPDRQRYIYGLAAIAVLVMAFIGVAMWIAFDATFNHAAKHVDNQVNCIGQSSGTC